FSILNRLTPSSTIFPYTTLFRSRVRDRHAERHGTQQSTKEDGDGHWPPRCFRSCSCKASSSACSSDSITMTSSFSEMRPVMMRRSEEHTSELQSLRHLVCRLLLE